MTEPQKPDSPVWEPAPKQSEFLSADEFEVLYGGAAGGGKSDGLLIDALGLQQGAIHKRQYQAILFRRTFPDLKDLIDRSQQIYGNIRGATYDKAAHVWTFPSGARIEFGHMQYDIDRFKYRGRAFQYVGFDELTLFPTSTPYLYLISRIRTVDPSIRCYVRATTNPDGPGSKWVKDYWRIPIEGTATCFDVELVDPETGTKSVRTRRFVPARLRDNPYLADSGYRETLLMLPDDERKALLLGRWESLKVKGAYYTEQLEAARKGGRICKVPILPHVPVNTFWDVGRSDKTVIWFHQRVGMEDRWIDCYANRLKPLSHYASVLTNDRKYLYGKHYLPHDADHKRLDKDSNGKSIADMLQELLPNAEFVIVDRIDDLMAGINMVRDAFASYYFDAQRCEEGLSALENYRAEWDDKRQVFDTKPLHDWCSDYADALRQHAQGYEPATAPYKRRPRDRHNWRTA